MQQLEERSTAQLITESLNILQNDNSYLNYNVQPAEPSYKRSKTTQDSDTSNEDMDCDSQIRSILQPPRLVLNQLTKNPQLSQTDPVHSEISQNNLPNTYNVSVSNRYSQLPIESTPASTSQTTTSQKFIPNIYIYDLINWHNHSKLLEQTIQFTAKSNFDSIKLTFQTPDDYRKTIKYLTEKNISNHTYEIDAENKPIKVIIRGLLISTPLEEIKEDLIRKGFTIEKVAQLTSKKNKEKLPLFLIMLPNNSTSKNICNVTNILRLSISIEQYKGISGPSQCYRCQRFGHSARYCTAPVKCMKCAKDHETNECKKSRDVPALCINCGGAHPACYRSCPAFKKVNSIKRNKHYNDEQQRPQTNTSNIAQSPEITPDFLPRYSFPHLKITNNKISNESYQRNPDHPKTKFNHQNTQKPSYSQILRQKPITSSLTIQEIMAEMTNMFKILTKCQQQLQELMSTIMTVLPSSQNIIQSIQQNGSK